MEIKIQIKARPISAARTKSHAVGVKHEEAAEICRIIKQWNDCLTAPLKINSLILSLAVRVKEAKNTDSKVIVGVAIPPDLYAQIKAVTDGGLVSLHRVLQTMIGYGLAQPGEVLMDAEIRPSVSRVVVMALQAGLPVFKKRHPASAHATLT